MAAASSGDELPGELLLEVEVLVFADRVVAPPRAVDLPHEEPAGGVLRDRASSRRPAEAAHEDGRILE